MKYRYESPEMERVYFACEDLLNDSREREDAEFDVSELDDE